jgi:hypothetical protein
MDEDRDPGPEHLPDDYLLEGDPTQFDLDELRAALDKDDVERLIEQDNKLMDLDRLPLDSATVTKATQILTPGTSFVDILLQVPFYLMQNKFEHTYNEDGEPLGVGAIGVVYKLNEEKCVKVHFTELSPEQRVQIAAMYLWFSVHEMGPKVGPSDVYFHKNELKIVMDKWDGDLKQWLGLCLKWKNVGTDKPVIDNELHDETLANALKQSSHSPNPSGTRFISQRMSPLTTSLKWEANTFNQMRPTDHQKN